MTRRAKELETPIVQRVLTALSELPDVWCVRNNTGEGHLRRKRQPETYIHFGLGTGGADIVGVIGPYGLFFALEVKTDVGKQTKEQACWETAIRRQGAAYAVVRSVDDALLAITMFRRFSHLRVESVLAASSAT